MNLTLESSCGHSSISLWYYLRSCVVFILSTGFHNGQLPVLETGWILEPWQCN